ncbi:MAG: 50S ribosomal protein L21 [Actinobacteria bacterium]|nr:50S ribosomal protein L21 [Actinomycetota bacterium]
MYAVITTGGKQYKVEENKDIVVERIEGKEGDKIKLPEVNMVSEGDKVEIGSPNIEKAIVEAIIKKQFKGDKVIAFKFKAKKRYKRKVGHRQLLTLLHLEKISTK